MQGRYTAIGPGVAVHIRELFAGTGSKTVSRTPGDIFCPLRVHERHDWELYMLQGSPI